MNYFLKGVFGTLLQSVASLGIMFHMFLVSLNFPVEMMDFFGLMFPMIAFDAFPVESLYEKIFKFSEINSDHALTDQFDSFGYSSIFIVSNIGSLFLIAIIQVLQSILLWLIRRFKPFKDCWGQQSLDQMADETLWNGLISFYFDNYLVLSVVSFIGCQDLRFGSEYTYTEKFCSFLAVSGIGLSIVFPISIFILYRIKLRTLDPNHEDVAKIVKIVKRIKRNKKEARENRVKELFQGDNLFVTML